jgi:potassium efflux system protein
VRDWNHRELIVPNKKLITENLINWTLSDSNYRIDLEVRIAYGSDTEKARDILLKIAADHPKILEKPRPKAIFRAFGPSGLEIEYRIYIPHMDFWPRVVSEVNTAIACDFKEAGIELAVPQQDIHIRSIEGAPPLADARPGAVGGYATVGSQHASAEFGQSLQHPPSLAVVGEKRGS